MVGLDPDQYLMDLLLLLSQGFDLLLQGFEFGGGAFVVLTQSDRVLQLLLQPIRV